MNIAINGFGRIGRAVFKILQNRKNLKVVAINDLTDTGVLAHLLKYDSAYGIYDKQIKAKKGSLVVGGREYRVLAERSPEKLPWKDLKVDVVIESTGFFRTREAASAHLLAGAKKVIISAPPKGKEIKTFVMGVNEEKIKKSDKIISNASCTTNCLAPVTDCVRRNFGIKKAIMTTIHSYTADQRLVDGPHTDLRRARAAAVNIVPTTTGAAVATTDTIPSLRGKFDGMAFRVPTLVGSLCDIVFVTVKKVDEQKVNNAFKKAAGSAKLKKFLSVSSEPLVSTDIIGNPASNIVDLSLTKVIGGDLLKVIAWYDNEWGYSNRMVDMVEYINKKGLI
ncbi:type I glyceraldehyde-3-phosphate dehydrogenase [Candidatus Falkowbacteria bacterium RIFOXYB2_FULL_34_18]|uniref:Glyceraldehyde-3-phosphate dehydrogenase n=1 Tax=Candidatus Falkowbacteria bacterium RIFOXYD2_FULL_34_120 TaxID=1798007 RepID=A0A1F5TS80_9BACT|nr:MAG: type I glyceraldehyde-3-phosphate dehydrogenase [Candidatus Falkowbacteria bacterium RIFOXYB2_FULL_34_18]OGF29753.1 MAG: type I glyceraldehyde-3-phosphate dehydrogenase [Candidatus Falkowbacteria bacterium RIFOXYC12_FULL_34_55]OGF37518.1 MAG: type I glyceraldehyde-3-phosphate dehydrogenase [Candidatus Falkowbacteria bacterium RIFOXYC2_FULL_34_220]OGF39228.1 MAG: type I glyceraldehyde-3-phosphate dehydrogenase [Candidatus Falkowbacteria bacterium RIFOXYD12_FULL_34_57]OGF41795.1 MAG: type